MLYVSYISIKKKTKVKHYLEQCDHKQPCLKKFNCIFYYYGHYFLLLPIWPGFVGFIKIQNKASKFRTRPP